MRQPAVANRFYSGSKNTLQQDIKKLLQGSDLPAKTTAIAAVSPHAGYIFSGALAARTLQSVVIPNTVIILGPNHHGRGARIALSRETWEMPLGPVAIDSSLAELLESTYEAVEIDETAHAYEHSLEVQVPFLQYLQPELSIVPLVLAHLNYQECESLGKALAEAIGTSNKEVLIVASSDMSHYESREQASRKDRLALDALLEFDARKLFDTVHANRISMCGVIPVVVATVAAGYLGATRAELIGYTDSGYMTGDTREVVGYAGVTLH